MARTNPKTLTKVTTKKPVAKKKATLAVPKNKEQWVILEAEAYGSFSMWDEMPFNSKEAALKDLETSTVDWEDGKRFKIVQLPKESLVIEHVTVVKTKKE